MAGVVLVDFPRRAPYGWIHNVCQFKIGAYIYVGRDGNMVDSKTVNPNTRTTL